MSFRTKPTDLCWTLRCFIFAICVPRNYDDYSSSHRASLERFVLSRIPPAVFIVNTLSDKRYFLMPQRLTDRHSVQAGLTILSVLKYKGCKITHKNKKISHPPPPNLTRVYNAITAAQLNPQRKIQRKASWEKLKPRKVAVRNNEKLYTPQAGEKRNNQTLQLWILY